MKADAERSFSFTNVSLVTRWSSSNVVGGAKRTAELHMLVDEPVYTWF